MIDQRLINALQPQTKQTKQILPPIRSQSTHAVVHPPLSPMKRMDVFLCLLFLFVFLPLCTVLGTVSAIQALLNDWSTSGLPFQCQSG